MPVARMGNAPARVNCLNLCSHSAWLTALLPKLVLASKFVGESPKRIKVRRDLWWTKTEVRRRILPWWYLR